jgi:hypothetical protein
MTLCSYGCNRPAIITFKNGKHCCKKKASLCIGYKNTPDPITGITPIQRRIKKIHTPNPLTGLTPIEQRQKTLRETIDPVTGLSLLELRSKKMAKTQVTKNPITGLTPREEAELKQSKIDPVTGLSLKQLAAIKAQTTFQVVDPETGLTKQQIRTLKATQTFIARPEKEKLKTKQKTKQTLSQIDPITGLTGYKSYGKKVSIQKNTINPLTGLTYAQEIGKKNQANELWLKNNSRGKASKESLLVFNPLSERLKSINVTCIYGHETGSEWFISVANSPVRYYDFAIPELKILIEFQGERYHPRKDLLTEQEWNEWRTPYIHLTADEVYNNDIYKKKIALERGFELHYVWSYEDKGEAIERLYSIVMTKFSAYHEIFGLPLHDQCQSPLLGL